MQQMRARKPRVWTPEQYRLLLKLRELGAQQLRKAGQVQFTHEAAIEAGMRLENNGALAPLSQPELKRKARKYSNHLKAARRLAEEGGS